jgi:hypothetical protein
MFLLCSHLFMVSRRRFPPPWIVRRAPGGFEVRDARGQRLAWIQAHENEFAALNAGILTIDEGRRIALGIARLPELMRRPASTGDDPLADLFLVVVEVDRGADRREEVARLRTGRLGLDLFEAFVRAFPGCTLTLLNGRHRMRLHRPD